MKKIITLILLLAIFWPGPGFSQKREKKKKQKDDISVEINAANSEVTNIYIDATQAGLLGDTSRAISLYESCLKKKSEAFRFHVRACPAVF